jgi:hypothetical protein
MVLPLLLATAAGSGMSMYGADKKKSAMRAADRNYHAALEEYLARKRQTQLETGAALGQMDRERMGNLGTMIHGAIGDQPQADTSGLATAAARGPSVYDNYTNDGSQAESQAVAGQQAHTGANIDYLSRLLASNRNHDAVHANRRKLFNKFDIQNDVQGNQASNLMANAGLRDQVAENNWEGTQMGLDDQMGTASHAGDQEMFWGGMLGLAGQYGAGQYAARPRQTAQPAPTYYDENGQGWY